MLVGKPLTNGLENDIGFHCDRLAVFIEFDGGYVVLTMQCFRMQPVMHRDAADLRQALLELRGAHVFGAAPVNQVNLLRAQSL